MIELRNIFKVFKNGNKYFYALNNISLVIPENKITIISGPSGSGKSTLLSIIGLLQKPSEGTVLFDAKLITFKNKKDLQNCIRDNISYVFQEFNLIDDFSVADNLLLVCDNYQIIDEILTVIGLESKKTTPTKFLSGGEKQRLAIGRAIAKSGDIVLLDEPTGNLDEENGKIIFELLQKFSRRKTIVVVTHDLKLAYNYADFIVFLNSGKIASTANLSRNSFNIDFSKGDQNLLIPLLEIISFKSNGKDLKIKVHNDQVIRHYTINSLTILSVFEEIYDSFKGTYCTLSIEVTKLDETNNELIEEYNEKRFFPPRFIAKYAVTLFKNKIWKNILSIVLLILNIITIFVYTNLATYDYSEATKNALQNNDAYYAQPYISEVNKITSEPNIYFSGENLFSNLDSFGYDIYPRISASPIIDGVSLNLSIIVIDKPVVFRGQTVNVPELDSIIISDFADLLLKETELSISFSSETFNLKYSLNVQGYVNVNYNADDINKFKNDTNYQYHNADKFQNEYCIAYISRDTFLKIKKESKLSLKGSNFLTSNKMMGSYADDSAVYKEYENNNLIAGRAPANDYEVVISSDFFERYKYSYQLKTYEDCLEVDFPYKDLNSSPNRDIYQTMMNFYDFTSTIKVVGITDDISSEVYATNSFMNSIYEKLDYYMAGFFVVVEPNLIKATLNKDIYFKFSYLNPILSMRNLITSDFSYIVLAAILIILVSTTIFLGLTFVSNVKDKYKEIAVLKSLGITKKSIVVLFLLLNFFIAFISVIIGLVLASISLHLVNLVLMSPSIFRINYMLINANYISFIIVILVAVIVSLISTLFALRKVDSIDVAVALKMY